MKTILNLFKILTIIFWVIFIFTLAAFILFGDQIIAYLHSFYILVKIKEMFEITIDTIETIVILMFLIMIPFTFIIFKLNSSVNAYKKADKPIDTVKAAPTSNIVSSIPKIEPQAKTVKKEDKKLTLDYYEIGLTGIKMKK